MEQVWSIYKPIVALILQALSFGAAVFFILLGVIGTIVPALPGVLLVWLTFMAYAYVERSNGFAALDPVTLIVVTIITLVTGLADLWLPYFGAKRRGSSRRSMLLGFLGAIIGSFIAPLIGTLVGYALGILLGEYHKRRDWQQAWRASLGGLASWGTATAIQLGGALLMLAIFVWQVLSYAH